LPLTGDEEGEEDELTELKRGNLLLEREKLSLEIQMLKMKLAEQK